MKEYNKGNKISSNFISEKIKQNNNQEQLNDNENILESNKKKIINNKKKNYNIDYNNNTVNSNNIINNIYILPFDETEKTSMTDELYSKIINERINSIPQILDESQKGYKVNNINFMELKNKYNIIYKKSKWQIIIRNNSEKIEGYSIKDFENNLSKIINDFSKTKLKNLKIFLHKKESDVIKSLLKEDILNLFENSELEDENITDDNFIKNLLNNLDKDKLNKIYEKLKKMKIENKL